MPPVWSHTNGGWVEAKTSLTYSRLLMHVISPIKIYPESLANWPGQARKHGCCRQATFWHFHTLPALPPSECRGVRSANLYSLPDWMVPLPTWCPALGESVAQMCKPSFACSRSSIFSSRCSGQKQRRSLFIADRSSSFACAAGSFVLSYPYQLWGCWGIRPPL